MEQATEWGGCSKAGTAIRNAFAPVEHLAGCTISGILNGIAKKIQKLDTEGVKGTRALWISKYGHLLEGFNLNGDNVFTLLVSSPLVYTLSRENLNAVVVIPELLPGINLLNPQKYPRYRFITVLGVVPDIVFQGKGYETIRKGKISARTDWIIAATPFPGQSLTLQLTETAGLDETSSLMLTIGIEFGDLLTDNLVNPVKHAGAAKILSMG
jgi:hypothetical protein